MTDKTIEELKSENEQLRILAFTDKLTGLHNLNYLEETIHSYINSHLPVSLLLLDIDNMKELNSKIGYRATDLRMKNLFVEIKDSIKERDGIFKIYGDEVVISANVPLIQAIIIADRLLNISRSHKLSISIGITTTYEIKDFPKLFNEANKALLQAKAAGKGCYQIYEKGE